MKRLTDTAKFDDPWYSELPVQFKLAWEYLLAKCDNAGVWAPNIKLAAFQIGAKIDWDAFISASEGRVVQLANGRWWVAGFVRFQYGKLSRDARVHQAVIKTLESHGIGVDANGIPIPSESLLTKEKEKDYTSRESAEREPETPRKNRCCMEEAMAFAEELGLPASDGEALFHKWEGNGWRNGSAAIKDWRATMRSWKANGYMPSQKQSQNGYHKPKQDNFLLG